jgi:endonuclease YncB( thermonuclease family)
VACESNPAPYYYGSSLPDGDAAAPQKGATKQSARVIEVTDGDTVEVRLKNGRRKDVRLVGIDTPEVYGGVECGGPAASRSMKRLLPRGTKVVLVSDPTQDKVDRYGRLLRYVMKAGKDVNRAQVERGLATVYVYNGNPFKRVGAYRTSQRRAKLAPRGIWRTCR